MSLPTTSYEAIPKTKAFNFIENIEEVVTWYNNKTKDGVFLHMSPLEIEQIAKIYNAKIVAHIATDGIGYTD